MLEHDSDQPDAAVRHDQQVATPVVHPHDAFDVAIQVDGATDALDTETVELGDVGEGKRLDLRLNRDRVVGGYAAAVWVGDVPGRQPHGHVDERIDGAYGSGDDSV